MHWTGKGLAMERAPMDDGKEPSQNDHEARITALERAMTGIEAEIRQLRQHMNDGFALLREMVAEIAKRVDRLESRVDRVETRIETRFDQLTALMRWAIGLLVAMLLALLGAGISVVGLVLQRLL